MTRKQLDMLLRYINIKIRLVNPALFGTREAARLTDELVYVVRRLEESTS